MDGVNKLLDAFKEMKYQMSLRIQFLHSNLDLSLKILVQRVMIKG